MDRRVLATTAVGAAGIIAAERLRGRPRLAAATAAGLAAAAVYAAREPDLVILVAIAIVVIALGAS